MDEPAASKSSEGEGSEHRSRGPAQRADRVGAGGGTVAQAKDVCLRLLTDRARSRAELAAKLEQKGFASDVVERTLDRLTEVGLIDDGDFAKQWVRSRHRYSGRGKRALALELRRKGIDSQDAAEALDTIDEDAERARAAELVRKKLRTRPPLSTTGDGRARAAERDKLVRRLVGMLARRGYAQGLAFEVVRDALAELGADADGLPTE